MLDARIIATSNIDIRREGAEGRFRKELVPHAAAVRIVVPPLRARAEDIPLLVRQFAREVCGAELDFVLVSGKRCIGVEVKHGGRATLSRSTRSFIEAYAPEAVLQPFAAGGSETTIEQTRVLFPRFDTLAATVRALVGEEG